MNGLRSGKSKILRRSTSLWFLVFDPHGVARQQIRILLAGLMLIQTGSSLYAEEAVYTWKDEVGRVHYSNRPPEGRSAATVELNARPVTVQKTEHIYSWTDANGKIHYGPKPPIAATVKELKEDESSLSTIHASTLRSGEQQLLRDMQNNH
jgi:hypothetical protein